MKPDLHHAKSFAYLAALACLLGAFGLRWLLSPVLGQRAPFSFFTLGTMLTAWLGGLGPGVASMTAGGLMGDFFFASAQRSVGPIDAAGWSALLLYFGVTSGVVAVIEAFRRARARTVGALLLAQTYGRRLRSGQREIEQAEARIRELAERETAVANAVERQCDQRFRRLADAAPVMLWTAGPDSRRTWFNRRWLDFTGRALEEESGTGWAEGLHESDRERVVQAFNAAFDARTPFETEYRLRRADGEYRWISSQGAPQFAENRAFLGYVGSCLDVTERKQAEEKLLRFNAELEQRVRERTAELEAANRELEAFSYSVSHDLRAPLRSVSGFSKAVLEEYEDRLDAQGVAYLRYACEASQRMSRLIEDLIALSRFTRCELRRQEVDLSAMAQGIFDELQQVEPQRRVKLEIAPQLKARGDEGLLRIALQNLLTNAWKFTGKQPQPRIELGATQLNGTKLFFVRDNGAGFNMNHADRLFGVFQRLHSTDDFPGTGIGLATVKRIFNRHGGEIWAEGAVNKGATFYFTLPAGS